MNQQFKGIEIMAVANCVPKNIVPNSNFDLLLNPKEMRSFEKVVGIKERRWAASDITASDLGFHAAEQLFLKYPNLKDNIGCLIFVSQTPDYKIPATSNILQSRLNLNNNILCLDVNAGCAGFVQGLMTAYSIAKSQINSRVLFIIAETMSKIISKNDRSTSMLFGDGASAIIIDNTGNDSAETFFNVFSDGDFSGAIQILDGGCRNNFTGKSEYLANNNSFTENSKSLLEMDGPKVLDFTLREVVPGINNLFKNLDYNIIDVDYVLLHQSNKFIMNQIGSRLNIAAEKILINIDRFGNTSGVSIPLLLSSFKYELMDSKNLLFSGYGVGLNWGNCFLKNASFKIIDLIEI